MADAFGNYAASVSPLDLLGINPMGAANSQDLALLGKFGPKSSLSAPAALGALGMVPGIAAMNVGKSAYDAATLPGDVYQGNVDLNSPEGQARTFNMATTLMGGGMPMAEGGAAGIFGGKLAKTADLGALETAQKMQAAGHYPDDIHAATGWFQGPDKQWRFEIPDDKAQIGAKALNELTQGGNYGATQRTAAGTIWHPELYDAYPQLRNADIDARYNTALKDSNGSIVGPGLLGYGGRPQIKIEANNLNGPNGVLGIGLHELQHGVQDIEGFAQGGSPEMMGAKRDQVFEAAKDAYNAADGDAALLRQLGLDVPDTKRPAWEDLSDREKLKWLDAGRGRMYWDLPGEVEARNVQDRMKMTSEDRRAIPPWYTK